MSSRFVFLSFFFFGSMTSNPKALFFSFESQYDGYVHPQWKDKGAESNQYFEDAVVVTPTSIVLGDGVGGATGFSGIYSHYQCLRLAEFLDTSPNLDGKKLIEVIAVETDRISNELETHKKSPDIANMATTLVYLHLRENMLLSGVAGDSGYSLYRFDENLKKMILLYRSRELVYGYNAPVQVGPGYPFEGDQLGETVEEGDVVFVASDGVLDVLPSSFITAATNYLVSKMVLQRREGNPVKDYDYDLADFLESYLHNLSQLAVHYKNTLESKQETKFKFIPHPMKQVPEQVQVQPPVEAEEKTPEKKQKTGLLSSFFGCFGSKPAKVKRQEPVVEPPPKQVFPRGAEPLENKMTNSIMDNMYYQEICNVFDPSGHAEAFESLRVGDNLQRLGTRMTENSKPTFQSISQKNLNCFTGKVHRETKLKPTYHDEAGDWACESIEDLTFPLHPVTDALGNFHVYKECVEKAIPTLPENTTPEEIANSFNSRYFSRNIGLAARFMSRDRRLKLDDFTLKQFYNHSTEELELPKNVSSEDIKWSAKKDDISVAAASIISSKTFLARKAKQQNLLGKTLKQHAKAIKNLFEKISARDTEAKQPKQPKQPKTDYWNQIVRNFI